MARGAALLFELLAKDGASPAFLRVAGAADKAAASTLRAQKSAATAGAGMSRAGAKLTKGLTLPLLGLAAVAANQAVKYESSLNKIKVATGQSTTSMTLAHKSLLDISVKTATSTDQLSEALYTAAKSGQPMAKALQTVTAAAMGAKAESADLGTVTNALTSVMASYGSKMADPVKAMNELVRAAGLAKVSTQDYAGSLSTVQPIAAAAGVSFDQLGGAIATLTQHGTTAQEATQELAFTIRNLQAPNNVAISAMNQLGLSATDISKSLGKRGLTGTFDLIASKLPKTGLVYVGAMKQMEAGTADLTLMQSKMSPVLRQASQQFLKGSLSAKEYRATYKGMGAEGNALGGQFLALTGKVKGYSDAVKNGTPAQKTTVSLLKQLMGGANGLNTYLQLTGESADYFAKATDDVKRAATQANGGVLGFAETTKTAAFKADQAKQSFHKLAVEGGTVLLPALKSMADAGTGALKWIDGLSTSQKKMLAWSAGLLVAVGPVLAIGGRLATLGIGIARFSTFAVAQLARFNTRLALSATGATVAMARIGAALGGAAIGAAVGTLTANANTAVKAVGVLGSAAAGAALGFGAGGGVGAVIGGLAGGLSALATQFLGAGGAAKQAIQPTDDYTNAILRDKDAVGANTRELVKNSLQKAGLYDAGLKLKISTQDLTLASLGNADAIARVNNKLLGVTASALATQHAHKSLTKAQQQQLDAAGKLSGGMDILHQTLAVNKHAADNLASADGRAANATGVLAGSAKYTAAQLGVLALHGKLTSGQLATLEKEHRVNVQGAAAAQELRNIKSLLDQLHDKTVSVSVNTYNSTIGRGKVKVAASGGHITGPGTGTSDSIPARLSNGEFVVRASQTRKHLSLLQSINAGAQGFAKGGTVGGIHYTTDVGYHNAQARAAQHRNTSNANAVSSSISGIGQSYTPPFAVADVGIGRMRSTISAAIHTLNTQIGKGLASGTAAGFRRQIASLTSMANAQLATLRVKIKGSDLSALRNGLKGSVDDTRAAFAQLITDISRSGGSAGVIGKLRTAGNKLAGMQGTLASAKEYGAGIGDTLRGAYDPTKAGSIADLHAGLSGATGQNKAYASQLNTLRAKSKGNAPLTAFINQLAASGNTATLATLAGASKGELAQTTKDLGAYNSSVSAGVNAATTEKYGKDTAAMQKQITETMNAVAAVVNAQANQKVTLQVGGEDVATKVVHSQAMQTALANLARLIK